MLSPAEALDIVAKIQNDLRLTDEDIKFDEAKNVFVVNGREFEPEATFHNDITGKEEPIEGLLRAGLEN